MALGVVFGGRKLGSGAKLVSVALRWLRKIERVDLDLVLRVGKTEMGAVASAVLSGIVMVKEAPAVLSRIGMTVILSSAVLVGEARTVTVDTSVLPAGVSGVSVTVVIDPVGPLGVGGVELVVTTVVFVGCDSPAVACSVTCQGCQQLSFGPGHQLTVAVTV